MRCSLQPKIWQHQWLKACVNLEDCHGDFVKAKELWEIFLPAFFSPPLPKSKMCGMNSPTCCICNVCSPQRSRFSRGYRSIPLYYYKPVGVFDHYFQCCCILWYWINCYDRRLRRTGPEQLNSGNDLVSPPLHSRVNGWSLPLHCFQIVALLLYTYLAIVGFGIYIPLLPHGWKHTAYAVIGILFVHHLIAHLIAITIDPADQNVLAKKNYNNPMPVFDRRKHRHVIQNQHCYLCEVDVGPKAKHCSACNKCIADFDHHCKWLNNCVGGKNYWFFFNAVVSAVLGVFFLVVVILYVFIQYFVNPEELRTGSQLEGASGNTTWLAFLPAAPVETTAAGILVIAVITVLLGTASLLLLGHLLGFHLYLLGKKLSTFDYMARYRRTSSTRDQRVDLEATKNPSDRMDPLQDMYLARQKKECEVPVTSRTRHQEAGQLSIKPPSVICTETSDVASFTSLSLSPQTVPKRPKETTCHNSNQNIEVNAAETINLRDSQPNCDQSLNRSHQENLHENPMMNSTAPKQSRDKDRLVISDEVLSPAENGRSDALLEAQARAEEDTEMSQSGGFAFPSANRNVSPETFFSDLKSNQK
ncbi:palmitoyltransferase ZDHHC11 isoform X2 [Alligator mississippiensis]|uniref:palmitoyltransferase ZDHHC11 isoform X2 n=1 Tax=Alligator mississippiensis TaxID=8496 RepID=UPI002877251F|nr:palmitoyltransferase ZDHHC11 isoform X2 [Alligator mississippiensis]